MMRLAFAGVALSSAEMTFAEFKFTFGKVYNGANEEARRESIFNANLKYIEEINAKNLTYTLGVNQFADMEPAEIATGLAPAPPPGALCGSGAYLGQHTWDGSELPDTVDWSQKGVVSPVIDQGHCGSCWSMSATGSVESAAAIALGKFVALSPQQLMDCSRPNNTFGSCTGGRMYEGFEWDKTNDLCTAESYPYLAADHACSQSSCTVGLPSGHVQGCKDVKPFSAPDLKSAVAQQVVSVAVSSTLPGFQLYKSGVLSGICVGGGLDHGILVVGYGTDPSGVDYWKVKNSWGTVWGESGYGRFAMGGICWSTGIVGLLTQPLIPIVGGTIVI